MSDSPVKSMKKKDLAVSRVFNAPVGLVWRAWSDPALVMRWWGPDHFTSPSAEIDFREAGTSLVCMRAPKEMGGQDVYSTWAYKKIVPMKLIEFIQNLADKDGNPLDPVKLGLPVEFPMDIRTGVTFNDLGKGDRNDGYGIGVDREPNAGHGRSRLEPEPRQDGRQHHHRC